MGNDSKIITAEPNNLNNREWKKVKKILLSNLGIDQPRNSESIIKNFASQPTNYDVINIQNRVFCQFIWVVRQFLNYNQFLAEMKKQL